MYRLRMPPAGPLSWERRVQCRGGIRYGARGKRTNRFATSQTRYSHIVFPMAPMFVAKLTSFLGLLQLLLHRQMSLQLSSFDLVALIPFVDQTKAPSSEMYIPAWAERKGEN